MHNGVSIGLKVSLDGHVLVKGSVCSEFRSRIHSELIAGIVADDSITMQTRLSSHIEGILFFVATEGYATVNSKAAADTGIARHIFTALDIHILAEGRFGLELGSGVHHQGIILVITDVGITVQVGSETIPFLGLPANGVVANFPEKGLFIATDKAAVLREIETMAQTSKQVLESVPAHQKMVRDCEALLLDLNPERKKEAMQAQEISEMRNELAELRKLLSATLGQPKKED